jgi:circadian clock protein KaiC
MPAPLRSQAISDFPVRSSTGIAELDGILHGGLPRGHLYLIEGEPGTGKTTLGLQFLLEGVPQGEKVMYVTLSESQRELEEVARSHQWALDRVHLLEYNAREASLRQEDQYSAFHPSEVELQDTMDRLLAEFEREQPHRVVLDSLSEIRLLSRDTLRYRRQVLALKQYFSSRDSTILLLDDRSGDGRSIDLQSLAHGVISMERLSRDIGNIRRRLQVVKLRGSRFVEGFHDYAIRTGGLAVFPRLAPVEDKTEIPKGVVSSGIAALDALWGGGLRRGSSTLLLGPAGAGKSSVAATYAAAAAKGGDTAVIYTFEESIASVLYRADQIGCSASSLFAQKRLIIEQIAPSEKSIGEFVHGIRHRVEKENISVLVIDSLNGFLTAMGEDFIASQLHDLLGYLSSRGVTCILILAQAGIVGAFMPTQVDVSYLADNVMLFRYFEAAGKVRKAVSVVKMRGGMHENHIRELRFVNNRLAVGNPLVSFRGILTGVPTFEGGHDANKERDDEGWAVDVSDADVAESVGSGQTAS